MHTVPFNKTQSLATTLLNVNIFGLRSFINRLQNYNGCSYCFFSQETQKNLETIQPCCFYEHQN